MDKISYYAIIPAEIRYDNRLKILSRLLYGELTALCNKYGYCWASNSYFANLYKASQRTISRCISELKDYGYIFIELEYKKDSKEVEKRIIKLKNDPIDKIDYTYGQNCPDPIDKNVQDNITSINNTSNILPRQFIPPTVEQVKEYCIERKNTIDAETFIDFYQSKGWLVGKTPMKDWKAAVRTWERSRQSKVTPIKQHKELTTEELEEFRRKRRQEIEERNNRGW